ncbi:MAG: hypothetical protein WDZ72_15055 [Cyclobacteriaceae bacterium]
MNSIIILLITYIWLINVLYPETKFIHPFGEEKQMAVITKKAVGLPYISNFLSDPEKWDLVVEGFSPAYYDKDRDAMAINTIEQPTDQWAAATTSFEHPTGVYTIRFTSLLESDGECSYVLKIGSEKVLDFQNPRIYGKDSAEYAPHVEEVKNITIEKGGLIQVKFLPHSNGLVPEGDGFGFARARWKSNIEFIPQQEE